MHGPYIRSMDRQLTGEEERFHGCRWGNLKGETESEIIAAQDQALQTKYLAINLLPTEIHSKCRHSKQFDETWNTSCQHAQCWQKNNTQRHD